MLLLLWIQFSALKHNCPIFGNNISHGNRVGSKKCSPVHHISQSYRISSGKDDFASRQYRCTSLLHLLCLSERNAWSLLYPVEIVWLDLMKHRGSLKTKWYFQRRNSESISGHIYLDEEVISFCLGRVSRIWLIKQVLNSHKNLFHSYGWSPTLHIPESLLCYTSFISMASLQPYE